MSAERRRTRIGDAGRRRRLCRMLVPDQIMRSCLIRIPHDDSLGSLIKECKSVALPVFQALRIFSNGETTTRVLRRRLQALLGADSWRDAADVFVHACPDQYR
jgi:hypothetical protein